MPAMPAKEKMTASVSETERKRLVGQLAEQLRQDIEQARRIGYNPTKFTVMLHKLGPILACQQVIVGGKIPEGFMRLLELRALELTAEATVLRGPWCVLFADAVLDEARKRLRAYQRPDLASAGPCTESA
jgi:hypothetical protein